MSNLKSYVIHTIGGGWGKETIEENLIKVSVIRGTDFPKLEKLDFSSVPIRFETLKKIESRTLQVGDLIIEVSGGSASSGQRTGRCLYITQEILDNLGKYVIPASFCRLLRLDKEKINSKFIYYQIAEMHLSDQIGIYENQSTGISNFQFNLFLDEIFPKITDLNKQNSIVDIFNSIDQKIQVNTKINQTLEQIAQALFKSWFVDFDPVRAKVQALSDGLSLEQAELAAMQAISGKTPEELTALSQAQPECYAELAETAKAFPCEMVEVDGVEVPKGWKIGTFTDITESRREKVKNDKATVLSAVSSGELVKSEEYFTKQVFSKSIDKYLKVYQWDFAYNPARINIGSIGLHEADYLGAVSPVYEVFSVSDKYHWFLKRILNLETTKIKIQSLCTGSVRQTLKLKDFQSIDCVIPDEKTLSIFNKKWEEYRTLILENNENTQTLSEIRDLLLPRLLSGDFNG